MSSAFAPFNNTQITFKTATGFQENPETGNWEAIEQAEVYIVSLKQASMPDYLYQLGIDAQTIFLTGRLISPRTLSPQIKPGAIAPITFQGQSGRFELLPDEKTLPQFQSILGQPIRGLFRMVGAGGDGSIEPDPTP